MSPSSTRENMKHAVQTTVDGFNNNLDYDTLRSVRADDFIYQFLPLTLGAPARNNEVYKDFFFSNLKPLFQEFNLKPSTTSYDEEERKATLHGFVDTKTPVGEWTLELVMMYSFDKTGEKITRIDEFFDSAVYSAFFAKVELSGQSSEQ